MNEKKPAFDIADIDAKFWATVEAERRYHERSKLRDGNGKTTQGLRTK